MPKQEKTHGPTKQHYGNSYDFERKSKAFYKRIRSEEWGGGGGGGVWHKFQHFVPLVKLRNKVGVNGGGGREWERSC